MKKLFFTLCLLNAPCFSMDLKDTPSLELVTQQSRITRENTTAELLLNDNKCDRIKKKLRNNKRNIGCCFAITLALSGFASLFVPNLWKQSAPQPQEYLCVAPGAQTGNLNWIARIDKCGKCQEWGTYVACPGNQNVADLYKRLNNSKQQVCPDARECIDLFESSSCFDAQPEWFFEQLDKELNRTCKIKAD